MFVLAHLSDPHLSLAKRPRVRDLFGKRLFGYLNLLSSRNRKHSDRAIDILVSDIHASSPDHVVVTGDLINLALPHEYESAFFWLKKLGPCDTVSVVPGNHDAYVRKTTESGLARWGHYMRGDSVRDSRLRWPYIRKRGPVALIGLSSIIHTAPWLATGRIGPVQLSKLPPLLKQAREEGLFRVILIHHPPIPNISHQKRRLTDADALAQILRLHGSELVLHGHEHSDLFHSISGPAGNIAIIGVPSASSLGYGTHPPGQYNLFHISRSSGRWQCVLTARRLCTETDRVCTLYEKTISSKALLR